MPRKGNQLKRKGKERRAREDRKLKMGGVEEGTEDSSSNNISNDYKGGERS